MILYLDRSRSAMIYPLDRSCLGHGYKIYRIISTSINNWFTILHIYYILTWIDHVLDIPCVIWAKIDSSQDYVLRADLSWAYPTRDVHNKIYSLRDWSLFTGGGGYKTGGGAREVLPLRKGAAEKVLAMLKGGAQQVLG